MFEAEIDVDVLIACMEEITAIYDRGVLNISAEGWKVNMVDPANVAFVSLELQSDAFDKFEFEAEEVDETGIKIGVDFENLLKMLKLWGEGKKVGLKLDMHNEKLSVWSGIFDYTIPVLKPSSLIGEPKTPKLKFPVQVIIEAEEFRRAIHAMEKVDEAVMLGVEEEQFYIKAKDDYTVLKADLKQVFPLKKEPGNFRSQYSIDYLSAMCGGMGGARNLTIYFNSAYPIQIDFDVGGGKTKVRYLLTPRTNQKDW